jgi:hypothetical protein
MFKPLFLFTLALLIFLSFHHYSRDILFFHHYSCFLYINVSRSMEIFFFNGFSFNLTVGLFRFGSKSQLVDFLTNFFNMIYLSIVSTTVFESTKSELV